MRIVSLRVISMASPWSSRGCGTSSINIFRAWHVTEASFCGDDSLHQSSVTHTYSLSSAVSSGLLLLALLMTGCNKPAASATNSIKAGPHAFLALGDSYTIGEAVDEEARWPVQLVKALRQKGLTLEDPTILARTGWTTENLQNALTKAPYV